ncbi:formate/nitrite transporter family protein [Spiroplasma monobiae]|uniref:Formate/nitrite transporter n=1 Tax=Spiroplasma monobiae MQ-1 TaxID=1336748 RepID=A0A2K9LVQ9_SPISQ|nr:formate/nitrite transporter family protein [Spiroplasma monobiae]AUM62435.1 formate/nitrite transporter [Spiroplasma monobiae MQ-1]
MNKNNNIEDEIRALKEEDYGILDAQHSFMVDGVLGGFKAAIHKLHYTFIKQILLGIMSGVIIGFGYVACIIAMVSIQDTSFKAFGTILLGFIFPGCIILITFLGGGLFTSHVFSTIPVFKGCGSRRLYLKGIFGVLLGNFAGTFIFVALFSAAGGLWDNKDFLTKVFSMAMHKMYLVNHDILNGVAISGMSILATVGIGIASGILCNMMVCATLPLASTTKNTAAIILMMIFPIAYFAIGGFQHGPANSFFMWMMLFEAIFNHSDVVIGVIVDGAGDKTEFIKEIHPQIQYFFLFIAISTLPTLIGNWFGGALLLPGILYFINKEYASVLFKKIKLEYLEEKSGNFKAKAEKQMKKLKQKIKEKQADIDSQENNKN